MALNLKHQTAAEFVARLREKYRNSSKDECARLAYWLYERYAAGDVTQAQIRTAFGLDTTAKWTAFRDKVLALRDHWAAILAARGE